MLIYVDWFLHLLFYIRVRFLPKKNGFLQDSGRKQHRCSKLKLINYMKFKVDTLITATGYSGFILELGQLWTGKTSQGSSCYIGRQYSAWLIGAISQLSHCLVQFQHYCSLNGLQTLIYLQLHNKMLIKYTLSAQIVQTKWNEHCMDMILLSTHG